MTMIPAKWRHGLVGLAALALLTLGLACIVRPSADGDDSPEPSVGLEMADEAHNDLAPSRTTDSFVWNEKTAIELVVLPLSCIDRLHKPPSASTYLYETTPTLAPDFERSLAFYGCSDWHSAVNSTWAMVRVLEDFPSSSTSMLIREKLENHLSSDSLTGELAFFRDRARASFERPYGWAWLMRLHTQLIELGNEDANRWAENLAPLTAYLSAKSLQYLSHLSAPVRVGTHNNTAFAMAYMLDYAEAVGDDALRDAVAERANEFYLNDTSCPVRYEPSGSDFLSPCLAEAVVMSQLMETQVYADWLDGFLPGVDSPEFDSLRRQIVIDPQQTSESESVSEVGLGTNSEALESPSMSLPSVPVRGAEAEPASESGARATDSQGEVETDAERDDAERLKGSKSHLIGLSFVRAAALRRIAEALPSDDARVRGYRQLASVQAAQGFDNMFEVDYVGTHWLASFAIDMLTAP